MVNFTVEIRDPEGDAVHYDLFFGKGLGSAGGDIPKGHKAGTPSIATTEFSGGTYNVTLSASDGFNQVEKWVLIIALGGPTAWLFEANSTVSLTCTRCSGAPIGPDAALGADGCQGFLQENNGTDCVWYSLRPGWGGHSFRVNATGDPDLEFRENCTAQPIQQTLRYLHEGDEGGVIPEGAGCLVVWLYKNAPSDVFFRIHGQ